MEEEKEHRHCCRFCKKRFPCGRSLGGHMRSHITALSSAEADEKLQRKQNYMGGLETGGYGLRENPKKTWRLSHLRSTAVHSQKGKVCRECGKRFRSRKALFGHMRCHPERNPSHSHVEERSCTGQDAFDSHSDNDSDTAVAMRRMRRSKRVAARFGASPSFTNASSSLSEVEQDTEEVAMCLMMLSRDVGTWGSLNSAAESSDNNSASPVVNKRSAENGDVGFACDEDELTKKPRVKAIGDLGDFDACQMEDHTFDQRPEFGASESGFSGSGAKKVVSSVSGDRFVRDDEFDGSDTEFAGCEVGLEGSNMELREESSQKKGKDCSNGCVGEVMEDSPKEFGKYTSISRARFDTYSVELDGDNFQNTRYDTMDFEVIKDRFKGGRYECTACNKSFQSYQALGGHRASHKKVKGCSASRIESSRSRFEAGPGLTDDNKLKACRTERSIDGEINHRMKKTKKHECPICFKVFASGQALGGHRRSHLAGNAESRATASQTVVIQHKPQENPSPNSLDLNLPAPIEEAVNDNVVFRSWWVEGNCKHEPLVGLISN